MCKKKTLKYFCQLNIYANWFLLSNFLLKPLFNICSHHIRKTNIKKNWKGRLFYLTIISHLNFHLLKNATWETSIYSQDQETSAETTLPPPRSFHSGWMTWFEDSRTTAGSSLALAWLGFADLHSGISHYFISVGHTYGGSELTTVLICIQFFNPFASEAVYTCNFVFDRLSDSVYFCLIPLSTTCSVEVPGTNL